jgi:hypothetical protein
MNYQQELYQALAECRELDLVPVQAIVPSEFSHGLEKEILSEYGAISLEPQGTEVMGVQIIPKHGHRFIKIVCEMKKPKYQ